MMKTLERLQILQHYIDSNRQVGHTHAMLHGVLRDDAIVLSANSAHGVYLSKLIKASGGKKRKIVSWHSMGGLRGDSKPLAIDNGTMSVILGDAIDEIKRLAKWEINNG